MNKLRRKDLREITDQLETLQELLQELQEQEEEYRDNSRRTFRAARNTSGPTRPAAICRMLMTV